MSYITCSLKLSILFLFLQCAEHKSPQNFISLTGKWSLISSKAIEEVSDIFFQVQSEGGVLKNMPEVKIPGRLFPKGKDNLQESYWIHKVFEIHNIPDIVLGLYLGNIKSIDETYLNGSLIGKTGSIRPELNQAFDIARIYPIPSHRFQQGKNHVLIKITDPGLDKTHKIEAQDVFIADLAPLLKKRLYKNLYILFICILCILTGVYFFIFIRRLPRLRGIVYFAWLCICIGLYLIIYEGLFFLVVDDFGISKKLEYTTFALISVFFLPYIYNFCKAQKSFLYYICWSFGVLLALISLIFVQSDFIYLRTLLRSIQIYTIAVGLIALSVFWIYRHHFIKEETFYTFGGFTFLFGSALFDIFYNVQGSLSSKLFSEGATLFLLFNMLLIKSNLYSLEDSLKEQSVKLSEIASHRAELKNFNRFLSEYFKWIRDRLGYDSLAIEIISHNRKKIRKSSDDSLLGSIAQMTEKEKKFSQQIKIFLKETGKVFFIPLHSINRQEKYRGFMLIFLEKNKIEEHHIRVFEILKNNLCMQIVHLDYSSELKELNQSLENKVAERTLEIRNQYEKLKKLKDKQIQFFAGITHDIRTPLSMLTMPVESLIQQSRHNNDKQLNALQKIKYNVYKVIRMISSLLDISKSELNKVNLTATLQDMTHFLKKLSQIYTEIFTAYNLTLSTQIPDESVYVRFDIEKIEKVMDNLLHNALKHSRKYSKIILSASRLGEDKLVIRVKNYGKGLTVEQGKSIFQPFEQIYDSKGIDNLGTGLGLSLSKEYVELHGGKIDVRSQKNQNVTFEITLPIEENLSAVNRKEVMQSVLKENYPALQYYEMSQAYKNSRDNLELSTLACCFLSKKEAWKGVIEQLQEEFKLDVYTKLPKTFRKNDNLFSIVSICIFTNSLEPELLKGITSMKENRFFNHIPVIILAKKDPYFLAHRLIEIGAELCLVEPIHPMEVVLENKKFVSQKFLRRTILGKNLLESELKGIQKSIFEPTQPSFSYFYRILKYSNGDKLGILINQDREIIERQGYSSAIDLILINWIQKKAPKLSSIMNEVGALLTFENPSYSSIGFIIRTNQMSYINNGIPDTYCETSSGRKNFQILNQIDQNPSRQKQEENSFILPQGDVYISSPAGKLLIQSA